MPKAEDILSSFQNKKVFSILDLKQGFNQYRVTDNAKKYLNFASPLGIFLYNVLPFGPKNGPMFFQHCMHNIFEQYLGNFVEVFVDDIVIYSDSVIDHLIHLR